MKILTVVTVVGLALGVAGCQTDNPTIIRDRYNIPSIPESLYNCPILQKYPEVTKLKDSDVARLLIQLRANNLTCKASLEGIRRFLADARNITR